MFQKRLYPGMMGGILGITILLWSPSSLGDSSHIPRNVLTVPHAFGKCSDRLLNRVTDKLRVLNLYSRYEVQEIGTDQGYFFRLKGVQFDGPVLDLPVLDLPVEESRELWQMSDWKTETKRYQFLDTGFRRLAPESNIINNEFMSYAEKFPAYHLRVEFSPEHYKKREALYLLHWRMHDAVMKKYDKTKGYLSGLDFLQLSWASVYSDNNDVFGLLSGDPKPADEMTWDELYDRLVLTMQIYYYGRRDYFKPALRGGLNSLGIQDFDHDDMLPFEFRLRSEENERIAAQVYERFDRGTTCELVRYARFVDDLPREAHDRFLLRVLERLEGRGMRTILASTDEITSKYFGGRYGFEIMMTLPTKQNEMKEYLMFMEVGSPRYEQLKADLKKASRGMVENR